MAVITIEYLMGCGGRAIGRMLAEQLQLGYIDREIVQGVARELQIGEETAELHDQRVAGVLERALTMLSVPGALTWMAPPHPDDLAVLDETVYHTTTRQLIEAAARQGQVVIVGHGASFALADWPGVMHIGLHAPHAHRVATIMARLTLDREQALRRMLQSDQDRARYIKRFYHAQWRDADHYHLMVNTAIVAPERVASLIERAWRESIFADR